MPYDAPDLAKLNLSEIAELVAARKLPPVQQWNPEKSGDSEMRIAADGRWFYKDGEITRPAMIRAFASLLRRESDGSHWLVTPQEKLLISVEDAPLLAVELQSEGTGQSRKLAFRLNTDDLVIAGADHAIELRNALPYLHVRNDLWAKFTRPVYYELAELALAEDPDLPRVWSNGSFFLIGAPE